MHLDSEKLQKAMLSGCFNVKTLSEAAGVSRSTISRALNSRGASCNMQNLGKFARALGCDPMELLKEA